jgi:endonuclease/exonuclease/phosphatase family metal-dependent hydrolase
VLIRSWNLFHGNTSPPGRRAYLEEMVRLASADHPDVLLLQEVPGWAVARLGDWSGMQVVTDLARGPRLPSAFARRLTALHTGLFRSLFTGQANAILVASGIGISDRSVLVLNPRKGLGIGIGERRICQIVRLAPPGASTLLLGHLHTTNVAGAAAEQAARAAEHILALAEPGEPIVLAGDFNVTPRLAHLGFSEAGTAIDHILVRGGQPSAVRTWPDERRRLDGMLLSDHSPIELDL